VFIADLLSKDKLDKGESKGRLSEEQREKLKTTANKLKEK